MTATETRSTFPPEMRDAHLDLVRGYVAALRAGEEVTAEFARVALAEYREWLWIAGGRRAPIASHDVLALEALAARTGAGFLRTCLELAIGHAVAGDRVGVRGWLKSYGLRFARTTEKHS